MPLKEEKQFLITGHGKNAQFVQATLEKTVGKKWKSCTREKLFNLFMLLVRDGDCKIYAAE